MDNIKHFYVYEHWRSDTRTCFYVGKGFGKRAWDFRKNRNNHYKNVISFLFNNGFDVHVCFLITEATEKEAFLLEQQQIKKYLAKGYELTNKTLGGEGKAGWKPSEDTRKKWSLKFTGSGNPMFGKLGAEHPSYGYKHSEEHKERMSSRFKGDKNPMFGKTPHNKGKESPLKGSTHSEETRRKRSLALRGENNPMYGKKISEETRRKMSESHKKRLEKIKSG